LTWFLGVARSSLRMPGLRRVIATCGDKPASRVLRRARLRTIPQAFILPLSLCGLPSGGYGMYFNTLRGIFLLGTAPCIKGAFMPAAEGRVAVRRGWWADSHAFVNLFTFRHEQRSRDFLNICSGSPHPLRFSPVTFTATAAFLPRVRLPLPVAVILAVPYPHTTCATFSRA